MLKTFFMITITAQDKICTFGPYINLTEADLLNLEYVDLLLSISNMPTEEDKIIEVVECMYVNNSIEVIWTRAETLISGTK